MKISEFAVRRSVTTAMLYVLLIVLGTVAIPKIPLEFMPKMDFPFIDIHIPYEGASPVEICDKIVEPVEESIATLPGVKKMRGRCNSGYGYIGVELNGEAKMDYVVLDVQERIDAIKKDLPPDVRNIMIMKFDTEQFPVIFGALTFPETRPENNELIERYLRRPLKTVEGVAEVYVEGLEERRILVEINENKLTAYGINIIQVFNALTSANLTLSAGSVEHAGEKHSVRIVGEFKSIEDIKKLPVTSSVRVEDVANVGVDYVEPFFVGRFNERRAYFISILKESGANTVDVCRHARAKLDELLDNPRMKHIQTKIWFDQSQEITSSLDILIESGIVGAILAFLVLWVFLKNIYSTLIVSAAVPMSLFATIVIMYFLGLSFNMITLSALIVGIGMLVDNSIVVLEAVDLRRRQGLHPLRAALEGAQEVGLAISVATTTTIIVFLPLIFTEQSQASVLMKQLGMVLALAIGSSLVVSLTLVPLMAAYLLAPARKGLPGWYQAFSTWFIRVLDAALRHRFWSVIGVVAMFFITIQIFIWPLPWEKIKAFESFKFYTLIEKEAVPSALMHVVRINVKFEQRPALEEVDAKMKELEKVFMSKREEWDIDQVVAIVTERFTRILLVLPFDRTPKYNAEQIKDMTSGFLKDNVNWPGITLEVGGEGHEGGPPGMDAATSIKVRGHNPEQVYRFAEEIRKKLIGIEGLKEIKPIDREGETELHVVVDRDQARQYGFELSQVAMAISYSVRGVPVGQFLASDTPTDIYIQVKDADKKNLAELEAMMIQNLRGQYIPLKNIAAFKQVPIPNRVMRDNRLITVRVPIEPEGKDLGEVAKHIRARLRNYHLPTGYSWVLGEEFEERNEDLKTLAIAILLAMALVFVVMTAQFESFFTPFVIMFELPFALIGVVFGLLISRATFNVLSGAGCLLLVGIVVNNAIVLVDHIHNLRKKGLSDHDSLIEGARDRIRPIMMTALTTIVGLAPMALGFNDSARMMYSPLAIAVLGGLVASTFLTPFIIPIIYSLSDDLLKWIKGIFFTLASL